MKVLVFFLLATISTIVRADLDGELGGMFSDMLNTTPGGFYDTQRRGIITGGNLALRNRISQPNLVSFVPPYVKGGCGGIDLFGGSFSFINGAQFTQLLRNISQNAVGYAFQLAIEGMCPTCSQVMSKLQKDIAAINSLMKNSCEAAKWAVNKSGLTAWNDKSMFDIANNNVVKGYLSSDFLSAKEERNPVDDAVNTGHGSEVTGNVVHESLTDASVQDWFVHGDAQLQRVLMSLTGTLVTGTTINGEGKKSLQYDYRQPTIETRDLIEGGKLKIYKCADSECLLNDGSPTETVQVTGMRDRVKTMLFGTCNCKGGTGGIIRKLSNRDAGETLTADEEKFVKASSPGVVGLLHRVSSQPGSASLVGEQLVGLLTVNLTDQLVNEMFNAVTASVQTTNHQLDTAMLDVMNSRRQQIDEQRRLNGETTAMITNALDTLARVEESLHQKDVNKQLD